MRTPQEYIADVTDDVLPRFMQNISGHALSANDQYHAEMCRLARNVGMNPESEGFKASLLLASDLIDGLAASLRETELEDKEMGAYYIEQAAARLRLLSLWGSRCRKDCLDLRS